MKYVYQVPTQMVVVLILNEELPSRFIKEVPSQHRVFCAIWPSKITGQLQFEDWALHVF